MKLVRAALLTLAVTAAGFALAGVSAEPAMAMCKYGSGDCVNPDPNFDYVIPEDIRIPEDNWIDPDCEHYGNCHSARQTGEDDEDEVFGTRVTIGTVSRR